MATELEMHSKKYQMMSQPEVSEPQLIGEFGVTEEGKVVLGRQYARYIYQPAVGAKEDLHWDLNVGFESYVEKPRGEGITRILDFLILKTSEKDSIKTILHGADVVCRRSLLNSLLSAPFCKFNSWQFDAIKRDGIIYLCERDTEDVKAQKEKTREDIQQNKSSYYGFKFEQCITSTELEGHPKTDEPVSGKEHRVFIQRTFRAQNLEPLSIAFTGEIDAIDCDDCKIELKTFREDLDLSGNNPEELKRVYQNFTKFTCLRWWGQSYMVGVDRVVVGRKTKDGIVNKVEEFKTEELKNKCYFETRVGVNFMVTLMDKLKKTMKNGDAFKVHFKGAERNTNDIPWRNFAILNKVPYSEVDFLPDHFLEHFQMTRTPDIEEQFDANSDAHTNDEK